MTLILSENSNKFFASLILIISIICGSILSILVGTNANNHKRKNKLIIQYIFIFITALLMSIYLEEFPYFVIFFLTNELLLATSSPYINAMTLEDLQKKKVKKIYSTYKYWIVNLSGTLGFFIGGILYGVSSHYLFYFYSIVSFINLILIMSFIKDRTGLPQISSSKLNLQEYKNVFSNKNYILLLFSFMLIIVAEASLSTIIILRLEKTFHFKFFNLNIDGHNMFSLIMMLNTLSIVLLTLPMSKFSYKKNYIYIGMFIYTIGFSVLLISNNFYFLCVSIILASIGEIIFSPAYEYTKIQLIPNSQKGTYSSIGRIFSQIAQIISKSFIFLSSLLHFNIIAILIIISMIIGFFIFMNISKEVEEKSC